MTTVRITQGKHAGSTGTLMADHGDRVEVRVRSGRRSRPVTLPRDHTDLGAPADASPADAVQRLVALPALAGLGVPDVAGMDALPPTAADAVPLFARFGGLAFDQGDHVCTPREALDLQEMLSGVQAGGGFPTWMPGEWWNDGWLPLVSDDDGRSLLCLDTVGCFDGPPGQLIRWVRDDPARPRVAPSLAAWSGRGTGAWRTGR